MKAVVHVPVEVGTSVIVKSNVVVFSGNLVLPLLSEVELVFLAHTLCPFARSDFMCCNIVS